MITNSNSNFSKGLFPISSNATKWHISLKSPKLKKWMILKTDRFLILKSLVSLLESKTIFEIHSVGQEKFKNKRGDNERTHPA
jgi:hypothetical protein